MSAPYVHMTINLMKKFGATVTSENDKIFRVSPSQYISPGTMFIEGDASSASYFLAGGAITGGPVTVYGCGSESVQVFLTLTLTVNPNRGQLLSSSLLLSS
jgi:3-phosphoshikimate 1-carboxyvinyltransferase